MSWVEIVQNIPTDREVLLISPSLIYPCHEMSCSGTGIESLGLEYI